MTKYCQKCGSPNDDGVTYCQTCGEMNFGSTPPSKISRPTVVTIIASLQIIISVFWILLASSITALLGLAGLGTLLAVILLLPLIFAVAVFTGRNWARILMLIGGVLTIWTIWGIFVIYYFTRPRVVAYFKQPK